MLASVLSKSIYFLFHFFNISYVFLSGIFWMGGDFTSCDKVDCRYVGPSTLSHPFFFFIIYLIFIWSIKQYTQDKNLFWTVNLVLIYVLLVCRNFSSLAGSLQGSVDLSAVWGTLTIFISTVYVLMKTSSAAAQLPKS
jgi:hypothetical protein